MTVAARGLLLVLLASLCLSTVPTAIKIGLADEADPLQLLAPRMILAVLLLGLWMAVTRPQRIRVDRRGLRHCLLAGVLSGGALTLFYWTLEYLDVAVAIVIFTVYPAILLVLLRLRGERSRALDWFRLLLAVAGVVLVVDPGGSADPRGVLLALSCATLYALYMLVVHTRLASLPASTSTLWILIGLAAMVVLLRLANPPNVPLGATGWAVVVWTAVVGTAVARLAIIAGIRLIGGGQTALLLPVETVLAVTWATFLLGESMTAWQLAGGVLVLVSVAAARLRPREQHLAQGP